MSEELKPVEVDEEIKAVMEDENFVPSPEDIECYGKHQIKPSEILPCPFCGSEYLQFGDWGTHGAYDKVACGNGCTDWIPVERWNNRPAEEALQKRISELEKRAEARKLANRVLKHKQKELKAKLNQWRKVLKEIAESNNGVDEDGLSCFFCDHMIYIAQKALEGAGE